MLNSLIEEYAKTLDDNYSMDGDIEEYSDKILEKIACELEQEEWESKILGITNKYNAMLTFWFLFIREIRREYFPASYLCYYFSSLVANDTSLPEEMRLEGNEYRALIMFKSMNGLEWYSFLMQALNSIYYKGSLKERPFLDLMILGDTYKAWNIDPYNYIMHNIRTQAPSIASVYPSYTKDQVIHEAELSHEAVLSLINKRLTKVW